MQTPTELANFGLLQIGAGQIQSIDGTDAASSLCRTYYRDAIRHVLSINQWTAFTRRKALVLESTTTQDGWSYKYQLPPPAEMVFLFRVLDVNNSEWDFALEGGYLYTNCVNAIGKYIYYTEEIPRFESHMAQAMGCYLGMLLAPQLAGKADQFARQNVEIRYKQAIDRATYNDDRDSTMIKFPRTWGQK